MDTGKGKFESIKIPADEDKAKLIKDALENKYPEHGGWFHVGQTVIINGSHFRIKGVKPTEIRLKLLPKGR